MLGMHRMEGNMELVSIRELYHQKEAFIGKKITVGGWVRSIRDSRTFVTKLADSM